MSLIPIPQEVIAVDAPVRPQKKMKQIRLQIAKKDKLKGDQHLEKTCLKLSEFIDAEGSMSPEDISLLINDMHRSTLTLQKQQQKLRRSTKNKKNRV